MAIKVSVSPLKRGRRPQCHVKASVRKKQVHSAPCPRAGEGQLVRQATAGRAADHGPRDLSGPSAQALSALCDSVNSKPYQTRPTGVRVTVSLCLSPHGSVRQPVKSVSPGAAASEGGPLASPKVHLRKGQMCRTSMENEALARRTGSW